MLFFDLEAPRRGFRVESLCRQVQEAVSLAMNEVEGDASLEGAWVADAHPDPGPERIQITVVVPRAGTVELEATRAALLRLRPYLRAEVARWIHRKRVPDLSFRVAAGLEGGDAA